jgi:hypothetical protein
VHRGRLTVTCDRGRRLSRWFFCEARNCWHWVVADRDAEDKVDVMELVTEEAMSSRTSSGCCGAALGVSKREARFPISRD